LPLQDGVEAPSQVPELVLYGPYLARKPALEPAREPLAILEDGLARALEHAAVLGLRALDEQALRLRSSRRVRLYG
jgi:hypothetical protein